MPRLRVLAGPSPTSLVPITDFVNTNTPHLISSDVFEGEVVVNIKGFTDSKGRIRDSEYFWREDRKGITWSIQVQGRFLLPYSADDILFGNTFDRPLKLPWGSGTAFKFMKYVDPTLEHDLTSPTRPWALSPLISTMPHFAHKHLPTIYSSPHSASSSGSDIHEKVPHNLRLALANSARSTPSSFLPFPPRHSLLDDNSQLHLALADDSPFNSDSPGSSSSSLSSTLSSMSSSSSRGKGPGPSSSYARNNYFDRRKAKQDRANNHRLPNLQTSSQRRSYFSNTANRQALHFGANVCYHRYPRFPNI
jgi:hypothetical protein